MTLDELSRQDVPFIEVDESGLVRDVNAAFEPVFGWTRAEMLGRPMTVIIPPALRDAHTIGFSRFLTTGTPRLLGRPLRLRARARDGREFDAEHLIVAEKAGDRWRIGATMRPLP